MRDTMKPQGRFNIKSSDALAADRRDEGNRDEATPDHAGVLLRSRGTRGRPGTAEANQICLATWRIDGIGDLMAMSRDEDAPIRYAPLTPGQSSARRRRAY